MSVPAAEMPSPSPAVDYTTPALAFTTSDQTLAACANSSSPICYNTTVSGANIITNMWFSAVLGALCLMGFVVFRGKFRFYEARIDMPQVTHKPPPMNKKGLARLWSWLKPVFQVSDAELLSSAGMDALIAVRILSFGIMLFLPITIFAVAILLPIHYTDDWYMRQGAADGVQDTYTTIFVRLTMSNMTPGSPLLWVHCVFLYACVLWGCWLITEHYKEYISLRQAYLLRAMKLPKGASKLGVAALGDSTGHTLSEAPPLLASRSPLKGNHVISMKEDSIGAHFSRNPLFHEKRNQNLSRTFVVDEYDSDTDMSCAIPEENWKNGPEGDLPHLIDMNGDKDKNQLHSCPSRKKRVASPSRFSGRRKIECSEKVIRSEMGCAEELRCSQGCSSVQDEGNRITTRNTKAFCSVHDIECSSTSNNPEYMQKQSYPKSSSGTEVTIWNSGSSIVQSDTENAANSESISRGRPLSASSDATSNPVFRRHETHERNTAVCSPQLIPVRKNVTFAPERVESSHNATEESVKDDEWALHDYTQDILHGSTEQRGHDNSSELKLEIGHDSEPQQSKLIIADSLRRTHCITTNVDIKCQERKPGEVVRKRSLHRQHSSLSEIEPIQDNNKALSENTNNTHARTNSLPSTLESSLELHVLGSENYSSGYTSGPSLPQIATNPVVAAALFPSRSTAAEAVAMIRHHRHMSGASGSAISTITTPESNNSPRLKYQNNAVNLGMESSQDFSPIEMHNEGKEFLNLEQHRSKKYTSRVPTDLSCVIQKVAEFAETHPEEAFGFGIDVDNHFDVERRVSSLPTSVAIAPFLASPQGQEGIDHRWWSCMSGLGNRLKDRESKQGMTEGLRASNVAAHKVAIPLAQLPSGDFLAADGSLYTVLVTDQPVEKLHIKRPLNNLDLWVRKESQHGNSESGVTPSNSGLITPSQSRPVLNLSQMESRADVENSNAIEHSDENECAQVPNESVAPSANDGMSNEESSYSKGSGHFAFINKAFTNLHFPNPFNIPFGHHSSKQKAESCTNQEIVTSPGSANLVHMEGGVSLDPIQETSEDVKCKNIQSRNIIHGSLRSLYSQQAVKDSGSSKHLSESNHFETQRINANRIFKQSRKNEESDSPLHFGSQNGIRHRVLFRKRKDSNPRKVQNIEENSKEDRYDPNTLESGIGISSGWNSTYQNLKQWWRHRGHYKEWRRDVKWRMCRKRIRAATEMFTELFGDDFDSIVPIYDTKKVDKLIHAWDNCTAQLERAQFQLKNLLENRGDEGITNSNGCKASNLSMDANSKHSKNKTLNVAEQFKVWKIRRREANIKRLKSHISGLALEVNKLQDQITVERDTILSDLPSTCFFATFKSQKAAAIAAQANLNPVSQRLFKVQPAPSPDDVNWPSLTRSWWHRQVRPAYVMPLILFIMLLPIGAFTGAFAQLTLAICGNEKDGSSEALSPDSWYCSGDQWATFARNLVTSMAPSILLSLYHMIILPLLVYYAAQSEGQCFSLSELDRRCCSLLFYWDVFNVFLGAMLGGSIISELTTYIDNPGQIWKTLSSAIPASSNFFVNYVIYRALVMAWFRLFYPHQSVVLCILKWLRIIPWAKTPRDRALEAPVRNCRYGRDIGIPVLMNYVMVWAYALVSPIILPFGVLYFILLWAVWRYQMLYVYQRQYESGGQFWPLVAHRVVACMFICVLFTATVLILKNAWTQAVIILLTLPLYLLRFDIYLNTRYDAVVAQVPLMAVHSAGRVSSVDSDLWTPPPLRAGAAGWNPEWGKIWQWWGIMRYTL